VNLIRTFLTLFFWILATPVAALVALPYTILTKRVDFLYRTGMAIAAAGVRLAGIQVSAEGLERLDPSATYIFLANHASNVDPPVLLPRIPRRTSVLVKQELFRLPILGRAMRIGQLVPVERGKREQAVKSLERAAEVLRSGINMTIFVEGTRSTDGNLLPFKKGPFYLAMETGTPVVPVTIAESFAVLPKGKIIARRGTVRLVFHEPIHPWRFENKEALMSAVRERIASSLPHERQTANVKNAQDAKEA
jgi:1-acyl-sn-glycerol-3-phosphate acyltransferase